MFIISLSPPGYLYNSWFSCSESGVDENLFIIIVNNPFLAAAFVSTLLCARDEIGLGRCGGAFNGVTGVAVVASILNSSKLPLQRSLKGK